MSTSGLPVLYSCWLSSCSWRVRIALKLKNIPHEIKTVDIFDKQIEESDDRNNQLKKEFYRINPMGFVPVLQIDGTTLIESLNILQYLEETRPQQSLLPDDALKRARVREICCIIVAGIQPLQNLKVQKYIGKDRELSAGWAQHWINNGFVALEKLLAKTAGTYCVGDTITLADCCLVPQVYKARDYKVDINQYPTIARIDKELQNHKAFADTHPLRQPDCPAEARQ